MPGKKVKTSTRRTVKKRRSPKPRATKKAAPAKRKKHPAPNPTPSKRSVKKRTPKKIAPTPETNAGAVGVDAVDLVALPAPGGHGDAGSPLVESQIRVLVVALTRQHRGEELTRDQQRLVTRWHKQQEERLRWEYYASIPQKHWRQMSGRDAKVINEQARLYGLPFDGATIHLPDLARAIHDMFADRRLQRSTRTLEGDPHQGPGDAEDNDEFFMSGGESPWLEEWRKQKAKRARLELLQLEKTLIPRDEIHAELNQMAEGLRGAAERLQKQFGPDAYDILEEALDDFEREIRKSLEREET